MTANHKTSNGNYIKRAILSDLLQGQLTVQQVIDQNLFASETEILDAIVKLINEAQRSRYAKKIEPQLTEHPLKPMVSHQPVAHAEAVHMVSNKSQLMPPPTALPQANPSHGSEADHQMSNRRLAIDQYERVLGLSFPNSLNSLSDFQQFVVEKICEQRLTLQTALDAEIFAFAGMDELTLSAQGAMISDNAGNYMGAVKLSEEMNMIHTQGRGDHIADGIANDTQSEQNLDLTCQDLEIQEDYNEFEDEQQAQDNEHFTRLEFANRKKASVNKKLARDERKNTKAIDGQALIDIIDYATPTPMNTK
jgi:predicted DNA-binding WGR domain protein